MPVLTKAGKPKRDKNGKAITISATTWLDRNRAVVQMTWCPGFPMLIKDRLVVDGGWIERADVTIFNHYRPPRITLGDAAKAGPWLDHVRKIYPDDANHIVRGWRTGCSARKRRSITPWCWADRRVSARTVCWSR